MFKHEGLESAAPASSVTRYPIKGESLIQLDLSEGFYRIFLDLKGDAISHPNLYFTHNGTSYGAEYVSSTMIGSSSPTSGSSMRLYGSNGSSHLRCELSINISESRSVAVTVGGYTPFLANTSLSGKKVNGIQISGLPANSEGVVIVEKYNV